MLIQDNGKLIRGNRMSGCSARGLDRPMDG